MPVDVFDAFLSVLHFYSVHVTDHFTLFACERLTKFNSRQLTDCRIPNFEAG